MTWQSTMNEYGSKKIPFLFIIDFLKLQPLVIALNELPQYNIYFKTSLKSYLPQSVECGNNALKIDVNAVDYEQFIIAFMLVKQHLEKGNSYLTNLSFEHRISCNSTLLDIFLKSKSSYKIIFKDRFVCFSPECFVKIKNKLISTYPMKGTIDFAIHGAEQIILNDKKEASEHATIVDLLRNDLSLIAKNIKVKKYRYIEKIHTSNKTLLQVSSAIEGLLPDDYINNLGTILDALLPAGSVSGAPKTKTLEIIAQAEKHDRDFYTGVFGVFDGSSFDSSVMIRYIEKRGNQLFYKSGAGITAQSIAKDEYQEILNKIYVPIH